MGLLDWFKETKENKEDLIKKISKAISKAKKGNSIDDNFKKVLASLSLDEIQQVVIPYYLELAPDDRGIVRKGFIESGFIDKVKTILKGRDNQLKARLLEIILIIRLNPGTSLLIEFLADKDDGVRWLAADILKEIKPRDGINLLIEKLKYPLKYPPARIGEILASYEDKAIEALFAEVDKENDGSIKAIAVLGFMPLGKVYNVLTKALGSVQTELKLAALEALEEKDIKEYSELPSSVVNSINDKVKELLLDNNFLIRIKSVNILSKLPLNNGEVLYQATRDENKIVRINALTGLKSNPEIYKALIEEIKKDKDHPLQDKV